MLAPAVKQPLCVYVLYIPHTLLVIAMISSLSLLHDIRIAFTLVSDPGDQDADCEELGTASLDLSKVLLLCCICC